MIELEDPAADVRDETLGPLERAVTQAGRRNPAPKVDAGSGDQKAPPEATPASLPSSPPPA